MYLDEHLNCTDYLVIYVDEHLNFNQDIREKIEGNY